MSKNKKKILIIVSILFFCLFLTFLTAGILITRPSIQKLILKDISNRIKHKINMEKMSISLVHGIGIKIQKLFIESNDKYFRLLCPKVFISYRLSNIIKGDLFPERIILEKPDLFINKDKIKFKKGKKKAPDKKLFLIALSFSSLSIKEGKISIKGTDFTFNNVDLNIKKRGPKKIYILFKTDLLLKENKIPFYTQGILFSFNKRSVLNRM